MIAIFVAFADSNLACAQPPGSGLPPNVPDIFGGADMEGVPSSAMLTERGRQLATELRNLRRSRNVMGPKHPSLPQVNQRIDALLEQLKAWAPANEKPEKSPFDKSANMANKNSTHQTPATAPPKMNTVDLHQLVIELSLRIEVLEKRIEQLENRLQVR